MYRLYFNPKLAVWQIQFLKFGILWVNVKDREFANLTNAEEYTKQTGIAAHYDQFTTKGMHLLYSQGARR